jgi:hypothetical protein
LTVAGLEVDEKFADLLWPASERAVKLALSWKFGG